MHIHDIVNTPMKHIKVYFLPKLSTILPVMKGPKAAPKAGNELIHAPSSVSTYILAPGWVIMGSVGELHDNTHVAAVADRLTERMKNKND